MHIIEHPLLKNKMYEAVPTVYAHIGSLNFETLGKTVIQKTLIALIKLL